MKKKNTWNIRCLVNETNVRGTLQPMAYCIEDCRNFGKKCMSGAIAVAVDFTFTFVVSGNTLKVEKLIHCGS